MSARAPQDESGGLGFALFAYLWAFSGLLDLASFDLWLASPFHAAWAAACVAVVVRPRWLFGHFGFHTRPVFLRVFCVVGAVGGVRHVMRAAPEINAEIAAKSAWMPEER